MMSRPWLIAAFLAGFILVSPLRAVAPPQAAAPPTPASKQAQSSQTGDEPRHPFTVPAGSILRLGITAPLNTSNLQPGTQIEGKMLKSLCVGDQEVIPAGSPVDLVVDKVERHKLGFKGVVARLNAIRTASNDRNFIQDVFFRSATLAIPLQPPVRLRVAFIQGGSVVRLSSHDDDVELGGRSKMEVAGLIPIAGDVVAALRGQTQWQQYRHPIITMQLLQPARVMIFGDPAPPPIPFSGEIASGTRVRLLLLDALSSADSHQGDKFLACVLEPIQQDGEAAIPQGSVLEGHVSRVEPPERVSRAGAVHLAFDKVYMGKAGAARIKGLLMAPALRDENVASGGAAAGVTPQGKRGIRRAVRDVGSGMATRSNGVQALRAATYFAPPFVGSGVGMALFIGRRGHEVALPQYSEIEIVFRAPLKLAAQH